MFDKDTLQGGHTMNHKTAVKEVERKVSKFGNSLGVTLPLEVLKHIGIAQGDQVIFNLEEDGTVSFKKDETLNLDGIEGVDQEFIDGLEHLFTNYDKALRNLADR